MTRKMGQLFISLPNDKILHQSNLKDFADHKINVRSTYVTNIVMGRVENIVGILNSHNRVR